MKRMRSKMKRMRKRKREAKPNYHPTYPMTKDQIRSKVSIHSWMSLMLRIERSER